MKKCISIKIDVYEVSNDGEMLLMNVKGKKGIK